MSENLASKEVFSVRYTESVEDLTPEKLQGFFVGWPNKPSPEVHLQLLKKSDHRVIVLNEKKKLLVLLRLLQMACYRHTFHF